MIVCIRRRRAIGLGLALLGGAACWPPAAGLASPSSRSAAKPMKEHVSLTLVKRTGSTKFDHSGRATGTIPGSVRSKIALSHSVVLRGTVTVTTRVGKLRMTVAGRARSLELRTRFNGTATVVAGTGRYAHASGKGTFTGVINRSTWAATIDADGSLSY
jgi:hypothetical protein